MSQPETFDTPQTPASASADPAAVNGAALEEIPSARLQTKRLGLSTFAGVYAPSLLAMMAVVPFLREGWIVSEAGVLGGILLVVLTFAVTASAAACLASIVTNSRDRTGGLHAAVSRSLGYEPAGVIAAGVVIAQTLAAALFLHAFAEAWTYVFPGHSRVAVAYIALIVVAAASLIPRTYLARSQAVGVGLVALAVGSMILGLADYSAVHAPVLWGGFDAGGFWLLFAFIFPAGIGVELGAGSYGALSDARRSVPRGLVAAAATAAAVCALLVLWYAVVPSVRPGLLPAVERAAFGPIVIVAVLVAALVAATTMLRSIRTVVQETRVLRLIRGLKRMGDDRLVTFVAALLVGVALLAGSLDRVAIPLALVYLTLYLGILAATAVEQRLGLISFRPSYRVAGWIPLAGIAVGLVALFAVSSTFALAALVALGAFYAYLSRPERSIPDDAVRSSAALALVSRAARRLDPTKTAGRERSWTPDLLVPVESRRQLDGVYRFLQWLTLPSGSLRIVGVRRPGAAAGRFRKPTAGLADRDLFLRPSTEQEPAVLADPRDELDLSAATATLRRLRLPATSAVVEAATLARGVGSIASLLRGGTLPPNVMFGLAHLYDAERLFGVAAAARSNDLGLALLYLEEEAGFGYERAINVWVSDRSASRRRGLRLPDLDLALLMAYQICRNWNGRLRLCTVSGDGSDVADADAFLVRLIHDARLPVDTERWTARGRFMEHLSTAPQADLHVLGLPKEADLAFLKAVVRLAGRSCLFARGSGRESALA